MSFHFAFLYISTVFIASIIPGPSMLLALTHGMQYGAKRTIASAMGNLTITLLQFLISIAGLGTLLIASETAFQIIKILGAAYLIYMGISILFSQELTIFHPHKYGNLEKLPLHKMYLQAATVTAGNPKAIVFFTAVFPQFIDSKASYFIQSLTLISIGLIIAFGCFMLYAISGQKIVLLFSKATFEKCFKRVIGSTFIGAGIGLAAGNKY